jgi:hypothetical protein
LSNLLQKRGGELTVPGNSYLAVIIKSIESLEETIFVVEEMEKKREAGAKS